MLVNGVCVILCGNQQNYCGASIAWATQVEKDHAMVSLPSAAAVSRAIARQRVFSISALGEDHAVIARQYGGADQAHPEAQNPGDLNFDLWATPVIANSPAQWLCQVEHSIDVGAQTVVIAKLVDNRKANHVEPLVYEHDAYFNS